MPNRYIREGIIDSERVNQLSWAEEVFYRRLMSIVDDHGRCEALPSLLRAKCFALRLDKVTETDVVKWKRATAEAGLVSYYVIQAKEYLQIIDFKQNIRSKSKYPEPPADNCMQMYADEIQLHTNDPLGRGKRTREEVKDEKRANALVGGKPPFVDPDKELRVEFDQLVIPDSAKDAVHVLRNWITEKKPQFIDPYVFYWNVFASFYKLPKVEKITEPRRRKFRVRIKETGFDFIEILNRAKGSEFLKGSSWFGFDWIFENESNYVKILEGNYK